MAPYSTVIFHRTGGLNLTKRWADGEMPYIAEEDWQDGETLEIRFSTGFKASLPAVVRKTAQRPGDADGRNYTDSDGHPQWMPLPTYAMTDPEQFKVTLNSHLNTNALDWAREQKPAHREAIRLIAKGNAQALERLLEYDYGLKTKSARLDGSNKLGITPIPIDAATMPGQVPLPRLITAQADIVISMVIEPKLGEMFGQHGVVSRLFDCESAQDVHSGYVVLDILTSGSIHIFEDMVRRRRQNSTKHILNPKDLDNIGQSLVKVITTLNTSLVEKNWTSQRVMEGLDGAAQKYHVRIGYEPAPGEKEWHNPRFWLPSLAALCEGSISTKIGTIESGPQELVESVD